MKPHGVDGTSVGCEFCDIISRGKSTYLQGVGKQLPVIGHIECFPIFSHTGIIHIFLYPSVRIGIEIAVIHLGHFGLADIEGHDTQMDRFHIADIIESHHPERIGQQSVLPHIYFECRQREFFPIISQRVGVFPFGPFVYRLIEKSHFLLHGEPFSYIHLLVSCNCHLATFGHVAIQGDNRIKAGYQGCSAFRLHLAFAVAAVMHRHAVCNIHFRLTVSCFGIIVVQNLIIVGLDADDREQVVVEDFTVQAGIDKRLKNSRLVGCQQLYILYCFLSVFLRLIGVIVADFHHVGKHRLINSRQSGVLCAGRSFLFYQVVYKSWYGIGRDFPSQRCLHHFSCEQLTIVGLMSGFLHNLVHHSHL